MSTRSSWRFTLVEVSLIGLLLVVATAALTRRPEDRPAAPSAGTLVSAGEESLFLVRSREELAELATEYGPNYSSRYVEEWIIRDYFQDKRNGVFLDVGAHHYKNESNTYFLESTLGWSGLAVEALPEFGPEYAEYRPRTRFVAMFASDRDGDQVTLFEPEHQKRIASISQDFTVRKGEQGTARAVPTATLNRLLREAQIDRIDFMSMDIELAEPLALAGFDLQKYQPALVCIEVHPEVRQQILDYFTRGGYVLVGKYLRIDPTNVYFAPLQTRPQH